MQRVLQILTGYIHSGMLSAPLIAFQKSSRQSALASVLSRTELLASCDMVLTREIDSSMSPNAMYATPLCCIVCNNTHTAQEAESSSPRYSPGTGRNGSR